MGVINVPLVATAVCPSAIAMHCPTAAAALGKISGAVYRALVVDLVCPTDHGVNVGHVGVPFVPIVPDARKGLSHRATGGRHCMSTSSRVDEGATLHVGT